MYSRCCAVGLDSYGIGPKPIEIITEFNRNFYGAFFAPTYKLLESASTRHGFRDIVLDTIFQ